MESTEISWLCEHIKKVRNIKASISRNSRTNCVKHGLSNVNETVRNNFH